MSKLLEKLLGRAEVQTTAATVSGVSLLAFTSIASAGTTGPEFQALYDLILGWAQGYLGKALAIAAFLFGAIVGVAKSTATPALIGIVFAIVFSIGPGVITGMMTAVI